MKWFLRIALLVGAWYAFWGCSEVNFSKDACHSYGSNCVQDAVNPGSNIFHQTVSSQKAKVDILFINDNSASMSYEQARLAARFQNFVQNLDSVNMEYRIAMVTTDISSPNNPPRTVNLNGELQNGKLVTFGNGQKFISTDSGTLAQKVSWFNAAIQRPETLACEQFITGWTGSRDSTAYGSEYTKNCPSPDERGIYAANLAVNNNEAGFIRDGANLVMIFLADEDIRSQLYETDANFQLDEKDKPAALIESVRNKFNGAKLLTVHSIIVKNGDTGCLTQQSSGSQTNGLVRGSYGKQYQGLAELTGGIVGNICDSDYTSQLGYIAANIIDHILEVQLACSEPTNLSVDPAAYAWDRSGDRIVFRDELPPGAQVNVTYSCPIQ